MAEEVFDQMAPFVHFCIVRDALGPVGLGGNDRDCAAFVQVGTQPVVVEGLVADQGLKIETGDQGLDTDAVVTLAMSLLVGEARKLNSMSHKAALFRLPIWTAAFVALICVGMLGLSGWREWNSRARTLRTAEIEMANLARSLTQHAEDTFELLDASIIGVAARLELEGTGPVTISRLQIILESRKAGLKRIHGLFIYDESGRCLATSGLAGPDISDREYFHYHMQSASRDVLIGNPVKRRPGSGWITTVSRRFNHPDGSFAGLVLATIGTEYFSEFYEQFEIGPNGSITSLNAAGIVLARSPDDGIYAGRDLSNTPLFRGRGSQPTSGAFYFKSPLDEVQRLSFYKQSDRFPLMVLATMAQDDVLAPWRKNAVARMLFVLASTSLIAIIGCFLVRQLIRGQRLVSALAPKEADFRLLAEKFWPPRKLSPTQSSLGVFRWSIC